MNKITLCFVFHYFFLLLSPLFAPPFDEAYDLDPTHYVAQFTIPSHEASQLLNPHWNIKGNKGNLSKMIGVSQPTLKALVDEEKPNKALRILNINLIEDPEVWKLFSFLMKVKMIVGELIRQTSLEDVAHQLEVKSDVLLAFLTDPKESEIIQFLPRVSLEQWPIRVHEEASSTLRRISATFDGRAIPGGMVGVSSFRAFSLRAGEWDVLYGSSDRNPGYRPPDQTPLRVRQEKHLAQFRVVVQGLEAADPSVSAERVERQLSQMSIGESPLVGSGEMYVQSPKRGKELHRHVDMSEEPQRRFYTDGTTPPNFVSRIGPSVELSEAFAHTLPKLDVFEGRRQYPMSPYNYVHPLPTGHTVTFDRGHGCDHADTLEHGGVLSTYDPHNYVPQNSFYNRHIRNPLVAQIRNAGGSYREFSLYHHNPYITNGVRIPETFIFVELYEGQPQSAYFFPNLVAYEFLNFEKPYKSMYLNYLELFRINALVEYFFNPVVQVQDPIPHMEQRNRADILSWRIPLDITILFDNMTEHAFPPRARSTLTRSVMNQSVNTAAILDFEGLFSLETAINHYGNDRVYWELDDRWEEERAAAFTTHLQELSQPIRDAVQRVQIEFPRVHANQRVFRRVLTQVFGHLVKLVRPSDQKVIQEMIGGLSIKNIDLARRYLQLAFKRIEQGDYTDRGLNGIQRILMYTSELEDPAKLKELDDLYKDPSMRRRKIDGEMVGVSSPAVRTTMGLTEEERLEGTFREYAFNNIFEHNIAELEAGKLCFETLFELLLIFDEENCEHWKVRYETVCAHLMALDLFETTLKEKKLLADFFWRAGHPDKKEAWIGKILSHFYENIHPKLKHAQLIASWIRNGIGCFPKDEEAAQEFEKKAEAHITRHRDRMNLLMGHRPNLQNSETQ